MNISKVIRKGIVFTKKWASLKREEIRLKSKIFELNDMSEYDEEIFKEYAQEIVRINHSIKENKREFKEAFGEFKDDTYYAAQRTLGNVETEYEETPSFRDEPVEVKKIDKDAQVELKGMPKDFRKKMNAAEEKEQEKEQPHNRLMEEIIIPMFGDIEEKRKIEKEEGESVQSVQETIVETEANDKAEEETIINELEAESEEQEKVELSQNIDDSEDIEEIQNSEEVVSEQEIEEERTVEAPVEELVEEDSEYEEAKKIIDSINQEGIKFSTKKGKELKAKLEELGYRLDIHYEKNKETKLWELR